MSAPELEPWEIEERADEDVIAPVYHDTHHEHPVARYWDDDFLAYVERWYRPGDRVLDLGCGPASLWEQWSRLPRPARLVGVDISDGMVAEARKRFPGGEFAVGRAHALPFEAGSFDLVIASSVLHHVPDERLPAAFAEISRVLGDYGIVVGREPSSAYSLDTGRFRLSGPVMHFRHLVFRLTRSREPGPMKLGTHHSVPAVGPFFEAIRQPLAPLGAESRFAFSPMVLRVASERVARLAQLLDERLGRRAGAMFYYAAGKQHSTAQDVASYIQDVLRDEDDAVSAAEFLALLQAAAEEVERVFAEPPAE